jgi:hypothetical protein
MQSIDPQQILQLLGPRTGVGLVFDIILYLIFILGMIGLFMQSDKQLIATLLVAAALLATVLAKLQFFDTQFVLGIYGFGALIINAILLITSALAAGITKAKGSRPLLVIMAVLAAVYFFLYWFLTQSGI